MPSDPRAPNRALYWVQHTRPAREGLRPHTPFPHEPSAQIGSLARTHAWPDRARHRRSTECTRTDGPLCMRGLRVRVHTEPFPCTPAAHSVCRAEARCWELDARSAEVCPWQMARQRHLRRACGGLGLGGRAHQPSSVDGEGCVLRQSRTAARHPVCTEHPRCASPSTGTLISPRS